MVCKETLGISGVHLTSSDAEVMDSTVISRLNFDHARVCVCVMCVLYGCVCGCVWYVGVCVCVACASVCVYVVWLCV